MSKPKRMSHLAWAGLVVAPLVMGLGSRKFIRTLWPARAVDLAFYVGKSESDPWGIPWRTVADGIYSYGPNMLDDNAMGDDIRVSVVFVSRMPWSVLWHDGRFLFLSVYWFLVLLACRCLPPFSRRTSELLFCALLAAAGAPVATQFGEVVPHHEPGAWPLLVSVQAATCLSIVTVIFLSLSLLRKVGQSEGDG